MSTNSFELGRCTLQIGDGPPMEAIVDLGDIDAALKAFWTEYALRPQYVIGPGFEWMRPDEDTKIKPTGSSGLLDGLLGRL